VTSGNNTIVENAQPAGDCAALFCAGDWVEVLSKQEILRTLDSHGQLEGLPFMPEMFAACGKRFRVYKRAHKTCDTAYEFKGRKMKDAVHLEGLRCDGSSHAGCQAECLLFWKTAWLKAVDTPNPDRTGRGNLRGDDANREPGCTEADVLAATRKPGADGPDPSYVCQATQLPFATQPLSPWEWRQYIEDYSSRNVGLARMAKSFLLVFYRRCLVNLGIGLGPALKWFYDRLQHLRGGVPYPHRTGTLPQGARTPSVSLKLQAGEWVRVKSHAEIIATCDKSGRNRGMTFDPEMVPYCGGTYQVLKRVDRIIHEQTGKMQEMKTACIILDSVVCQARYCDNRLFCPRSVYPYWREIWLERVAPHGADPGNAPQFDQTGSPVAIESQAAERECSLTITAGAMAELRSTPEFRSKTESPLIVLGGASSRRPTTW
jgi:hypothetical protein